MTKISRRPPRRPDSRLRGNDDIDEAMSGKSQIGNRQSQMSFGFTLIELMIVVAIVALLSAIAMPKFGELLIRSKESTAKGALGTFRSAIDIYYVGNEGLFPTDVNVLVTADVIDFLPATQIPPVPDVVNPGHGENARIENYASKALFGSANEGTNIWAYVNAGLDLGHVGFNCTHKDTKGSLWSEN